MRRLLRAVLVAALIAYVGPVAFVEAHHQPGKACDKEKQAGGKNVPRQSHEKNPHCNGSSTKSQGSDGSDQRGDDGNGNPSGPKDPRPADPCNPDKDDDCDGDDLPNDLDQCDTQRGLEPCSGGEDDPDADGVPNWRDNCDTTWNPGQENQNAWATHEVGDGHRNHDEEGDACDFDADGDGQNDDVEALIAELNARVQALRNDLP